MKIPIVLLDSGSDSDFELPRRPSLVAKVCQAGLIPFDNQSVSNSVFSISSYILTLRYVKNPWVKEMSIRISQNSQISAVTSLVLGRNQCRDWIGKAQQ